MYIQRLFCIVIEIKFYSILFDSILNPIRVLYLMSSHYEGVQNITHELVDHCSKKTRYLSVQMALGEITL